MKHVVFVFFLVFSANLSAGVTKDILNALLRYGSYAGAAGVGVIMSNRDCGNEEKTRVDFVNTYLWDMHRSNIYEEKYAFYLKYLENSEEYENNINIADTVAWVYFDKGDYKKAIGIYKNDIIPWLRFEPEERQERFTKIYTAFQKRGDCFFSCKNLEDSARAIDEAEEEKIKKEEPKEKPVEKAKRKIIEIGGKIKNKVKDVTASKEAKEE